MRAAVVRFGENARGPTAMGVDILADLVACTLGPAGRAVLVGRRHAAPRLLRNGYAIAAELELDDLAEQTGVRMLRELAWRTSDAVGDGTSTAILLARALLRTGRKAVLAGLSQAELIGLIEAHAAAVVDRLEAAADAAPSGDDLRRFTTQTVGGDVALGELLAQAHEAAGADGLVVVEAGKGSRDGLRYDPGMHLDQGWLSPHLVDDPRHGTIELDDPLILVHAGAIDDLAPVLRVLEMVAEAGRSLLILADSLAERALAVLVANKRRAGLKVAAVKAPGAGPWRRLILEDVALATGATLIAADLGTSLAGLRPQVLGRADRVQVGREATTIFGGRGDARRCAERVAEIRGAISREQHLSFDREQHRKRLARLISGIATLAIGGLTPSHLQQRVELAKGASAALGAARSGGIVFGGSAALVHAANLAAPDLPGGIAGALIGGMVKAAAEAPLRAIVRNAGCDTDLIAPRVAADRGLAFDALRRDLVPLAALRDPLPVVVTAWRNAVSTASRLLTVDCAVSSLATHARS